MEIFYSIEEYAKVNKESQVALGFFDGVHLGHRAVIRDCVENKGDRSAVVLTFGESPARLLGNRDVRLITDNARKAELLEELGVDAVIFANFLHFKDMEPEVFIERILHEKLNAKKVSCGYNYRFGRRGVGDTNTLHNVCAEYGIEASVNDPVDLDGMAVSSSAVRELLQNGEIETADRMLGYAFSIRGSINSGNQIGTAMGFPTVNIPVENGMVIPRFGVYASQVTIGGKTYRGATNIGVHPTVGENPAPLCETFLLDYRGEDLRGEFAVCTPTAFIRPERRFDSVDALAEQVGKDIETIKNMKA